ncbi:MAG: type II toxin-antitoxin system prevent-host-death family antitoxin [Sphingomicrobium sp.]
MLQPILARAAISISDLKRNPSAAIEAADGAPVAILNHNKASAYLVPALAWEELMELIDDMQLAQIVREREHEVGVEVSLDDL